jgi:hypothetical protein
VKVIFGWRDVLLVAGLLLGWRRAHERLRPEALRPRHEFVGLQRFSDHVPSNLYILSEAKQMISKMVRTPWSFKYALHGSLSHKPGEYSKYDLTDVMQLPRVWN